MPGLSLGLGLGLTLSKGVGVATNVLRSPIDNAILLSPINGQQMTTPRSA